VAVAFSPESTRLASGSGDGTVLLWDLSGRVRGGKLPAVELSPKELAAAWDDLVGADAARAHRAIWALVAARGQTTELLRRHLRPVPAAEGERVQELLKGLGSARFSERERAAKELEKAGLAMEPALRKVLESPPSLEVRRRMELILDRLAAATPPAEQVRALRAVEVLERLGTAEARRLLEGLARGAPQARLTHEARASRDRLARRAGRAGGLP
jgi:hypothetical protein